MLNFYFLCALVFGICGAAAGYLLTGSLPVLVITYPLSATLGIALAAACIHRFKSGVSS